MAKLIVSRARQLGGRIRRFRIRVDGRVAASVACGQSAEIRLEPGRHRITAQLEFLRSRPVEIVAGEDEVHHLRVGSSAMRRVPLWVVMSLPMLLTPAFVMLSFAGHRFFSDPLEVAWFRIFLIPMVTLPVVVQVALMILWREHFLYLEEIPAPDRADRPSPPPRDDPLRVRFTVRGLMVAVLVLAVLFAAGVEWARFTRGTLFQNRASRHAQLEAVYREIGRSLSPPSARRSAARAAAKADYHAAMRHKYEEAAARHAVSVEPDPPEPPWP